MLEKFKVTFLLMIDPTQGDATFKKSYKVEALTENEAYKKAEALMDVERDPKYGELKYRSIFDYSITKLNMSDV